MVASELRRGRGRGGRVGDDAGCDGQTSARARAVAPGRQTRGGARGVLRRASLTVAIGFTGDKGAPGYWEPTA